PGVQGVVEGVLGGDLDVEGVARDLIGDGAARAGLDLEVVERTGVDGDRLQARDGGGDAVGRGDRLAARRLECGAEAVDAVVAPGPGGEGVVGREARLGIRTGEFHRPGVAGGGVAI